MGLLEVTRCRLGLTVGYRKDMKEKRGQTVRDGGWEVKKQAIASRL